MAKTTRPGDGLLDRYLPNSTEAEREEAREIFGRYALHLVEIAERLIREGKATLDSTEMLRRPTIQTTPLESSDA